MLRADPGDNIRVPGVKKFRGSDFIGPDWFHKLQDLCFINDRVFYAPKRFNFRRQIYVIALDKNAR